MSLALCFKFLQGGDDSVIWYIQIKNIHLLNDLMHIWLSLKRFLLLSVSSRNIQNNSMHLVGMLWYTIQQIGQSIVSSFSEYLVFLFFCFFNLTLEYLKYPFSLISTDILIRIQSVLILSCNTKLSVYISPTNRKKKIQGQRMKFFLAKFYPSLWACVSQHPWFMQ